MANNNKIKLMRATARVNLPMSLEYGEIAFLKNAAVIVGNGDGTDFTINDYNKLINNPTGTGNQVFGMTASGAGREYKTIAGTTNQVDVTHAAGLITLSTPQSIHTAATPQFLRLGLGAAAHATSDLLLNTGTIFSNAIPTGNAYTLDTFWLNESNLLQLKNATVTKLTVDANGNITAGTYNTLALAATATGFTIAGGTASKTLTTHTNFTIGAAATYTGNITIRSSDTTARTLTLATSPTINSFTAGNVLYANADNTISGMIGTANQLLGMNSSATAPEFKTISGTANQVNVSFGANAITLSGPQDLATTSTPQFLRLGVGTAADATYNIKLANGTVITGVADGATAVGFTLETPVYSTAGAKLLSIKNDGQEKVSIDKDGIITGISLTSAGCYTNPALTDNGDGTVTLATGEYVFASDAYPLGHSPYRKYSIPGATYNLTDNTLNYIVANYNNGSPIIQVITNVAVIDEALIIPIYSIFRYGTELSFQSWDTLAANLGNKIHRSIVKTQRYRRQDGLMLSEQPGRYLTLSAGTVYIGATEVNLTSINSAAIGMVFYYHTAGAWTRSNISAYNNTQYDNGTDLALTSSNNYVVNWVYRGVISNQHMYIVLGTANYAKLTNAQAAQPPALPPEISSNGMLVGKIIVQQGAASATELLSAFTITTSYAVTANHNDLLNLQGGGGGVYFHSNQGINTTDTPTFANVIIGGVNYNTVGAMTKEPTGFDNPDDVIFNYDPISRTITLTGTFQGYWRGSPVTGLTTGWVSPPHGTGLTSSQFLYYNGTTYVWSSTAWSFDMLQIAIVTFDPSGAGALFATRECHGFMPWQAHQEFHQTMGTYTAGGGDITAYTLNSTTAANRRPDVSTTSVKDEDIISLIPALTTKQYTQYYLTGAAGTSTWVLGTADIVPLSGSRPYYNQFTGGVWQQTLMSNNDYMSVWLYAIPTSADAQSQQYRYIWVQGQATSANLANEQARTASQIQLGALVPNVPEVVAIGKVIIQYSGGNWTLIQVDKITGTKVSQSYSPSGNYLASVTTDGTLSGAGTSVSPLHVAGLPSPFNVDATVVSTTGTQLNYLNAATGYTGLNTSNVVFSNAPTLVDPILGNATATSLTAPTVNITGLDSNNNPITSALTWSQTDGTVQFPLQNGVTGQVFQENYFYGQAFEAISNGDVVMYGGAINDRIQFKKANAASFGFYPGMVIGVATQSFAAGQLGYVTWFGRVSDIDTSSWVIGDLLFLDPVNPGKMVNSFPAAPAPRISVGIVEKADVSGRIFVRPRYYERTLDLADVTITSPLTDHALLYDSATSTWKNSYISLAKATLGGSETSSAISITNTTGSSSTITGALKVAGGVGIAENVHVGGSVVITGDLTVKGTTTTVESTITSYKDPVITLGGNTPPTVDDGKDRGIEFRWHNGTVAKTGFFGFDRSTNKLLYIPDATNTAEVFTGTKGTIDANLEWADILSKPTTISGYGITDVGNGTLTLAVSGTGLSGSASFTANQAGASSFTVTSNATALNTASTIVARNGSGDFAAGTITAALSGNASTATKLATARNFSVSGEATTASPVAFDGSGDVALSVTLSNSAVISKVLTGYTATTGAVAATDTILQAFQKLGYDQHVAVSLATNSGLSITGQQLTLGTPSSITGTSTNTVATSTHSHALTTGYGDGVNPYASKTAKYFLAAPNAGDGVPSFRAIVASDIPTLNQNTTGQAGSVVNATFTTALTVTTGSVTISGDSSNTSALTLAAGASSIGGSNTGDVTIPTDSGLTLTNQLISLGTPGSITGTSLNAVSTSRHTHALTAGYGDGVNPYASKTANYILAAPNGSAGAPAFRALVAADLPVLTSLALTGVSNQLILGTTNKVTISATAPAAPRTYTIPDSGGSGNTIPVSNATPVSNRVVKFTGTAGVITNSIITDDGAGITLTAGSLTAKDGYFFRTSGTPSPAGTTKAVYDGHFYATKLFGDGSSLTGLGASASVADDTSTAALYPMLTAGTGTQALKISSTKLFFNASTAKLGVGTVAPSEAISAVGNLAFGPSEGKCKIQYNATEMSIDFVIN